MIVPFLFGGLGRTTKVATPVPSDPYFSYVVALLHMEGADASTTFTDQKGHTFTPGGNAQIDTAQFKFGSASALFDGTGDYLTTPSNADWAFGAGDFTIELWFRTAGTGPTQYLYENRAGTNSVARPLIYLGGTSLNYFVNGVTQINGGIVSTNTWYHLAVARSGTSTKMFLNGTQIGSTWTDNTNYSQGTLDIGIHYGHVNSGWNGWIDDLRITKGACRYASNFTPPAAAFFDF